METAKNAKAEEINSENGCENTQVKNAVENKIVYGRQLTSQDKCCK